MNEKQLHFETLKQMAIESEFSLTEIIELSQSGRLQNTYWYKRVQLRLALIEFAKAADKAIKPWVDKLLDIITKNNK